MARIRLAEKSAERQISSEEYSEEDVASVEMNEGQEPRKKKIRKDGVSETKGHETKHKLDRVRARKLRLMEKKRKEQQERKVNKLMLQHLGGIDVVKELNSNGKRSFIFKCPVCGNSIVEKLKRHLMVNHDYAEQAASLKQSELRVLFLWCKADKHKVCLPAPCETCNEWYLRIDHHFASNKRHKNDKEDQERLVAEAKRKIWFEQGSSSSKSLNTKPQTTLKDRITTSPNRDFVYRSKPSQRINALNQKLDTPVEYLPPNAQKVTAEHRKKWEIKDEDYVTIYYPGNKELLDAFYDNVSKGRADEHNNALQHRNKVEYIWECIDPKKSIFPKNSLSNVHLLRNHYHVPTFNSMGTEDGVHAPTLRSRYTSLNFFLQFLRTQQIFAGMSRLEISLLSEAINDFNKELNPHVKQRKVDVRRQKVKVLIGPNHFIRYGRSQFIQNLVKSYKRFLSAAERKKITRKFALEFRDYIIASLCIGNGLRASNVIELKVKDFLECGTDIEYPGHKVVTNSSYKTSTIYGEKFIVVPNKLYDQFLFYEKHLRHIVNSTKSTRAFLPASAVTTKMCQANVCSSLTATFKLANVFTKNEFERVSCTRIRCGVATYACNEGGYETAFFAKHFMKNREETTSIHYNLLSNRRHALGIAMKLYKSFSPSDGVKVTATEGQIDSLTEVVKKSSSKVPGSVEVMKWLKEKNQNLSSKELTNFTEMLRELEEEESSNIGSFYSSCTKVVSIYNFKNNVLLVNIHLDILVFGVVFIFCVLFQKYD